MEHVPAWTGRRWWGALLGIAAVGVGIRVLYVLVVLDPVTPGADAAWYTIQGVSILDGTGFMQPVSLLYAPEPIATAAFPPVYPTYQAAWQWLFGYGTTSVRLAGVVTGVAAVVLTGLLGRRVANASVGLLAAAVVTLDATLVAVDGSTMSEGVTVVLVLATVLLGMVVIDGGGRRPWLAVAALGVVGGLAVLTRADLALLVGLVALGMVTLRGPASPRLLRRVGSALAVLVLSALVVLPWAVRNERAVGMLTIATTSPSSALAGSYCDTTFSGADLGSWSYPCVVAASPAGAPAGPDEAATARSQQAAARRYLGDHLSRLPVVLAAREARVWGFWDPHDLARRDAEENRRYGWQLLSRPLDAALAVAGTTGLVVLARRRLNEQPSVLLLFAPLVVVCLGAAVTYGNPRFNAIAHPMLAIGVAVLVGAALQPRPERSSRWWP
jgi:hypothetical protein